MHNAGTSQPQLIAKIIANIIHFYELQVFRHSRACSFRERKATDCHCCPPNLLSATSIRWLSSRMNHSTSALLLPHLNQLVHLPGVFPGQAPCAFCGSRPRAQLGLLGCPAHTDWHIWLRLWKVSERVDSSLQPPSSTAKPSPSPAQDHTAQTKQDVPDN